MIHPLMETILSERKMKLFVLACCKRVTFPSATFQDYMHCLALNADNNLHISQVNDIGRLLYHECQSQDDHSFDVSNFLYYLHDSEFLNDAYGFAESALRLSQNWIEEREWQLKILNHIWRNNA